MKFVREHCAVCGKDQAMPVVQEDKSYPGLIWVRCPDCQETKPLEAPAGPTAADPGSGPASGPAGSRREGGDGPEASRRVVRYYRAGERFSPGEWIYHPEWDDTGQIVEKRRSEGGHDVIVVSFEKMGTRRLISNFVS